MGSKPRSSGMTSWAHLRRAQAGRRFLRSVKGALQIEQWSPLLRLLTVRCVQNAPGRRTRRRRRAVRAREYAPTPGTPPPPQPREDFLLRLLQHWIGGQHDADRHRQQPGSGGIVGRCRHGLTVDRSPGETTRSARQHRSAAHSCSARACDGSGRGRFLRRRGERRAPAFVRGTQLLPVGFPVDGGQGVDVGGPENGDVDNPGPARAEPHLTPFGRGDSLQALVHPVELDPSSSRRVRRFSEVFDRELTGPRLQTGGPAGS